MKFISTTLITASLLTVIFSAPAFAEEDLVSMSFVVGATTPILLPTTSTLAVALNDMKKEQLDAAKESAATYVATNGAEGLDANLGSVFDLMNSQEQFSSFSEMEKARLVVLMAE